MNAEASAATRVAKVPVVYGDAGLAKAQLELLELIVVGRPLMEMLNEIARTLEALADGMLCSILLLDDDGLHLRHGAAPSLPESYAQAIDGVAIGPAVGSCGTAAYLGRQVIVKDIGTDALWADYRELALGAGLRACWSTPVRSREGAVLGTFALYYDAPRSPEPHHLRLVEVAVHLTAIVIERERDLRERERLLRELNEAVKWRDNLISIASHELRTPLSSLLLQLDSISAVIDRAPIAVERLAPKVEMARRQVGRLQALIDDLLDVSRVVGGRLRMRLEPTDLVEVVREVVDRLAQASGQAGCSISTEPSPPVLGHWDRARLDQVVTNLLSNAIKFGAGAPIAVTMERRPGCARLTVSDEGVGIPLEKQSLLFQRFGRAVSESQFGGLGLGLWISRQIVEAHGGHIDVSSAEGAGARFTVELPCD